MSISSFSVAITGAGGSGAVTTGLILLESMAHYGFYGLLNRSSGPQIRGGESAVFIRFDDQEVLSVNNHFDYLLALDWFNIERFIDEIPLGKSSVVIYDSNAGAIPEVLQKSQAQFMPIDFKTLVKTIHKGRANMIGLGLLANTISLPFASIETSLNKILGRKGADVINTSAQAIRLGMTTQQEAVSWPVRSLATHIEANKARWSITGNEACGLGALKAGVRFVAAYPITPATEILEWLSPRLEKLGGGLLQAEDELASINMIIGASFGGVASLTATSGPGLSLMLEGIGLAIASETPVVIINVSRGGPSTGIPTKSEQSDLNIALYGCHGDAPHLVLAPLNIADAVTTTFWATGLAEQLQTVAIVLCDQFIGQSRAIIDQVVVPEWETSRVSEKKEHPQNDYQRYKITENAVSPMSIPGTPNCLFTADGLEHNSKGIPSSISQDHIEQLKKRQDKLLKFDYGAQWAKISGSGDIVLITWGSSSAMVQEAAHTLKQDIKVIALRLLMPLPVEALVKELHNSKKVFVIEQNQGQQLFHYLHSYQSLPVDAHSFARSGPLPLRPAEIVAFIKEQL